MGPTQPLIQRVPRIFSPGVKAAGDVKLATQHRMVPMLGMSGAVLPFPLYELME